MPSTPAVPSSAPTSAVAFMISSATSTPSAVTVQRTVVRVRSRMKGLRRATRSSSVRLASPAAEQPAHPHRQQRQRQHRQRRDEAVGFVQQALADEVEVERGSGHGAAV